MDFSDLRKRAWSWLFPKAVEVRLLSQSLPTGQLELWPEFWIGGNQLEDRQLGGGRSQFIGGYRVKIPKVVQEINGEFQGNRLRLRPRVVAQWIKKYSDKGIAVSDRGTGRAVHANTTEVEFDLSLNPDDSLEAKAAVSTPDGVELDVKKAEPIPNEDGWYRLDDTIFERGALEPELGRVVDAGDEGITLTGDAVPDFIAQLEDTKSKISGVQKNKALQDTSVFHRSPENKLTVDGDDDRLLLEQSLVYQDARRATHEERLVDAEHFLSRRATEEGYKHFPKGWVKVRKGDLKTARRARQELPGEAGQRDEISGTAIPETLVALAEEVRRGSPWNIYVSERARQKHRLIDEKAQVRFKLSVVDRGGGESLLQLDPLYQHQRQDLRHAEIAAAVGRDERWVRRARSWVKIDREKYVAVGNAIAQQNLTPSDGGFTFPASEREQVLESLARLGQIEQTESYSQFLRQLLEFHGIEHIDPPTAFDAGYCFRPYQQHGYNWLAFLRRFGLNGILADDMGLGKTLQALAVIRHSRETKARGSHNPSLIICPVSLMANWEAEAKRFFPGTTVAHYRGPNRQWLRSSMYYADLVITSYTVAAHDCDELCEIPWNFVVLDEAHAIKNPAIQRTQRVKRIWALHKLALTGTPVQNAASDLWSIFDFLMPGYLGSLGDFRENYPTLFDKRTVHYGSHANDLRKRVGPFVLRRLKKDVATELPEKILADRVVELTEEQVALYRQILGGQEARRLKESIERNEYRTQGIHILALLTKLRHICNHPALARNDSRWKIEESAKLSALEELMEELLEGEHRALIFSQFTSMLDIIELCLPEWEVKSLRIDGSTPVPLRQKFVDTFNSDESYHCVLLSTRAGGLGLNLTGADTVIFYDHDWNPTNDEQAQDRAYRIGQTKNVTVYRLITKGTIEEKILRYQERKKALAQALIGVDEQGFKNLTREELLSLFTLDAE